MITRRKYPSWKRLNDYEDKWYLSSPRWRRLFAKLQSNSSAVTKLARRIMMVALPNAYAQYNNSKVLTASPRN